MICAVRNTRCIILAMLQFLVLVIICGCQSAALTQDTAGAAIAKADALADSTTPRDVLLKMDQPLRAFALVRKMAHEQKFRSQEVTQYSAFLGRDAWTREMANTSSRTFTPDKNVLVADLLAVNAIQEIVAASQSYRVVILNETHDSQRQRTFAHLLAKALKESGFSHLGVEAIKSGAALDIKKHGPTLKSGFYTADPVFADFLRQATAMGYAVFDYEQRPEQEKMVSSDPVALLRAREEDQAKNIMQLLDAHPESKVFLYVGGGHGAKVLANQNRIMMARHLMALMEADVLSINQGAGTPQSQPMFDTPIYQAVTSALLSDETTVFRKKDDKWLRFPGYDMVVFHPRVPEIHGRGAWMTMKGYRKLHGIKIAPLPERTLVRARTLPLQTGGVAMDQVLINPLETQAALFLPIGEYELFRESETGVVEKIGSATVR